MESWGSLIAGGAAPARLLSIQYGQRTDSGKVEVDFQSNLRQADNSSQPDFNRLQFSVEADCGTLSPIFFMHDTPQMYAKGKRSCGGRGGNR